MDRFDVTPNDYFEKVVGAKDADEDKLASLKI